MSRKKTLIKMASMLLVVCMVMGLANITMAAQKKADLKVYLWYEEEEGKVEYTGWESVPEINYATINGKDLEDDQLDTLQVYSMKYYNMDTNKWEDITNNPGYHGTGDYKITYRYEDEDYYGISEEIPFKVVTYAYYPASIKATGWYWVYIDGLVYFKNGVITQRDSSTTQTGWVKRSAHWYYYDADGNMKTGWVKDKGKWYYLINSGIMVTNWQKVSGKWYYLGTDGVMQTGWQKISGKWYYLGTNGAMTTGWQKIGGKWYYMNKSGVMMTGWQKVSGKWYYLGTNGAMTTGWQKVSGKWYYMDKSGIMQTGWIKLSGKWYYLGTNGVMVTGTQTINGKTYTFNSNGVWVK